MAKTTQPTKDAFPMYKPHHIRRVLRALQKDLRYGDVPAWLSADAQFLLAQTTWILAELSGMGAIPHTEDTTGAQVPYAFSVSRTILPTSETEEMIDALAHFSPDDAFLRTFPVLRSAEVLCALSGVRSDDAVPQMYGQWISQLYKTKELDWTRVVDALSTVGKTLSRDPRGEYACSTAESKGAYRHAVAVYAHRHRMTEAAAAEAVLAKVCASVGEARSLARVLSMLPNEARGARVIIGLLCVSFLLSATGFVLCLPIGVGSALITSVLLYLPLYACLRETVNAAGGWLATRVQAQTPLLRMQLSDIPETAKTLVVTTALLCGGEHDDALFASLRRFALRNPENNVMFGLLADLPSADAETVAGDEEILARAMENLTKLEQEYGKKFALFVRNRRYAPGEGTFMGWERKRGAVLTLVRYLRGKCTDAEFRLVRHPGEIGLLSVSYVCTLDSDTNLPHGALVEMVSALMHPANHPIYKKGRVAQGCAIVQPAMACTPMGAIRTKFTRLCAGVGGWDAYHRAQTDGEEFLYGIGNFCGKGMFSVDAYDRVLADAFPENAVLSHDFAEGCYLGCRNLRTVTLSDSVPRDIPRYFARQSRWVRGDVQMLRFVFSRHKNAYGDTVDNPLSASAKLRMFDHVLSTLVPVMSVLSLLWCSFLRLPDPRAVLFVVLSVLWLFVHPLLLLTTCDAWRGTTRHFASPILPEMSRAWGWATVRLVFLPTEAVINLSAFLRALYRMCISRKHLLAWVTAGANDRNRDGGTVARVRGSVASVLAGVVLLFTPSVVGVCIGVLFLCAPWLFQSLAAPLSGASSVSFSDGTKKELASYAREIWAYFADHVTRDTHYLPPDNVQWFPGNTGRVARRTSPTDIGMYLACCGVACDMGYLTPTELSGRLSDTLSVLESLETVHGHYYNWYSTDTAQRIGEPFLSTVDSGNFVCSCLVAAGACRRFAHKEASLSACAARLGHLADRTDFSFLYDETRKHLSVGYNTETQRCVRSCYDLYASEARSAVYFAVSRGQIPAAAWYGLSRPVVASSRGIGMLSWTGSAFEYFMPGLWLPVPLGTASYEMQAFAARMQYAQRVRIAVGGGASCVAFGKSEGAYFAVDRARNFQYRPCGVGALATVADMDKEQLVMPYALFLMLASDMYLPVTETLRALRAMGFSGEYGFFEAIDLTRDRVGDGYAVVPSVMAHHLGMSFLAIANALSDDIVRQLFSEDPYPDASQILLWERIPTDARSARVLREEMRDGSALRNGAKITSPNTAEGADVTDALLSNTQAYVYANRAGYLRLACGDLALSPCEHDMTALPPLFFLKDTENGRIYVPFCAAYDANTESHALCFSFSADETRIRYCGQYADGRTAVLEITESPLANRFLFRVSLCDAVGEEVPFALTFFFRPVLYAPRAYAVHPTFADLFLTTTFTQTETQTRLCVTRHPQNAEERSVTMTLSSHDLTDVGAITDAAEILPTAYTAAEIRAAGMRGDNGSMTPSVSAVTPLMYLHGCAAGSVSLILDVGMAGADSTATPHANDMDFGYRHRMLCGGMTPSDPVLQTMLASVMSDSDSVLRHASEVPVIRDSSRGRYYRHGMSGDVPHFVFCVGDDTDSGATVALQHLIQAWKYLLISGITTDLVVCVSETDVYANPITSAVKQCAEGCGVAFFLGQGLFILRYEDAVQDGICACATYVFTPASVRERTDSRPACGIPSHALPVFPPRCRCHPIAYQMTEKRIVIEKGNHDTPWTYVLSNRVSGTLVTMNTLGFTFFGNAAMQRLTPWYGQVLSEKTGEFLYLRYAGEALLHDIVRDSDIVILSEREVHYVGTVGADNALAYRVTVSFPDRRRRKEIRVFLQNNSRETLSLSVRYEARILLGSHLSDRELLSWQWEEKARCVVVRTLTGDACHGYCAELGLDICDTADCRGGATDAGYVFCEGDITLAAGESCSVPVILSVKREGERAVKEGKLAEWTNPYRKVPCLSVGSPSLDALANTWLPIQIVSVRMWGRCGYYQPGGAYGFRDQLQDAMGAAVFAPELLREQLYRCAAHQYVEGDVQHWWHPGTLSDRAKSHRGIRSRCSDDFLWLPLAAARYLSLTGDEDVFAREIRYLESVPLGEDEAERYEEPLFSRVKESLYMHCIRAIEHTVKRGYGIHGLPLIGCGDWNDGMNRIGIHGDGESVWCGMFRMLVLYHFVPICRMMGDNDGADKYEAEIRRLAAAIESDAWNGQWYRRAWYDDGTPIGDPDDRCAEIDLLPQAFAAIVNARVKLASGARPFDPERVKHAMLCAYEKLYDAEHGVFALLDPPFDRKKDAEHDPGYIAGYGPGIRENGGQYTHAAVWGVMGLFAIGEDAAAVRVLRTLDPAWQTRDEDAIRRYKKEPWALCGDVLRTAGRVGEGGWSQYTGSAGWYYRLLYEVF